MVWLVAVNTIACWGVHQPHLSSTLNSPCVGSSPVDATARSKGNSLLDAVGLPQASNTRTLKGRESRSQRRWIRVGVIRLSCNGLMGA